MSALKVRTWTTSGQGRYHWSYQKNRLTIHESHSQSWTWIVSHPELRRQGILSNLRAISISNYFQNICYLLSAQVSAISGKYQIPDLLSNRKLMTLFTNPLHSNYTLLDTTYMAQVTNFSYFTTQITWHYWKSKNLLALFYFNRLIFVCFLCSFMLFSNCNRFQ